jgi:hypothetical protein
LPNFLLLRRAIFNATIEKTGREKEGDRIATYNPLHDVTKFLRAGENNAAIPSGSNAHPSTEYLPFSPGFQVPIPGNFRYSLAMQQAMHTISQNEQSLDWNQFIGFPDDEIPTWFNKMINVVEQRCFYINGNSTLNDVMKRESQVSKIEIGIPSYNKLRLEMKTKFQAHVAVLKGQAEHTFEQENPKPMTGIQFSASLGKVKKADCVKYGIDPKDPDALEKLAAELDQLAEESQEKYNKWLVTRLENVEATLAPQITKKAELEFYKTQFPHYFLPRLGARAKVSAMIRDWSNTDQEIRTALLTQWHRRPEIWMFEEDYDNPTNKQGPY